MKAIRLTLIAMATVFSFGIANADSPRDAEIIIVTAPMPRPIDRVEVALPAEVKPDIDYTSLTLEPPKLDFPGISVERSVEVALNDEAKTKS